MAAFACIQVVCDSECGAFFLAEGSDRATARAGAAQVGWTHDAALMLDHCPGCQQVPLATQANPVIH